MRTPVPLKDVAQVTRSTNAGAFEKPTLRSAIAALVEVVLGAVERGGRAERRVQSAARCSRGEVGGEVTV